MSDPFERGRRWRAVQFSDTSIYGNGQPGTDPRVINERLDPLRTIVALDEVREGAPQLQEIEEDGPSALGPHFLAISAHGMAAVDLIVVHGLSRQQRRAALFLLRSEATIQLEMPFVDSWTQRMMQAQAEAERQEARAMDRVLLPSHLGRRNGN